MQIKDVSRLEKKQANPKQNDGEDNEERDRRQSCKESTSHARIVTASRCRSRNPTSLRTWFLSDKLSCSACRMRFRMIATGSPSAAWSGRGTVRNCHV